MADYKHLRAAIDKKLSTDPEFRTIVKRINGGRATFIDTERYAQIIARAVSRELSAEVLDLSDREGITTQILRDSYEDINATCARVQRAMDEKAGIHIRPQQEEFPAERVQQLAHSLVDTTVEDSVIKRRAKAGSDTIIKSCHDDFIRKNATFRNDAGLTCYIIREGSNCCEWCSSVAGKYKFGTQPDDIFRRHDNCDCTIIYDGQVLRGKQNADGSRSKTWEEVPDAASSYNPTVLSPEEAERLQAKNQPKILTIEANGGKIKTVGINNVTGENATIDKRKFTEYALNPEKQPDKAKAFESALGYNLDNYELLENQIRGSFARDKLIEKGHNPQGDKYELHYEITGVNGKTAKVLTAWLDDINDQKDFHLTSLYVDK